jgi:hypothetical protein
MFIIDGGRRRVPGIGNDAATKEKSIIVFVQRHLHVIGIVDEPLLFQYLHQRPYLHGTPVLALKKRQ